MSGMVQWHDTFYSKPHNNPIGRCFPCVLSIGKPHLGKLNDLIKVTLLEGSRIQFQTYTV